ncbi:MAG: hypothetical protein AVDCRST_MAG54-987, partial [uncultured Actinomycetospora sp.]
CAPRSPPSPRSGPPVRAGRPAPTRPGPTATAGGLRRTPVRTTTSWATTTTMGTWSRRRAAGTGPRCTRPTAPRAGAAPTATSPPPRPARVRTAIPSTTGAPASRATGPRPGARVPPVPAPSVPARRAWLRPSAPSARSARARPRWAPTVPGTAARRTAPTVRVSTVRARAWAPTAGAR